MQMNLSFIAFALLVLMVISRAILMHKKGIRAIVFGRTDKSDFMLLPAVLLLVYSILSNVAGLPMWSPLIRPFWDTDLPGWIGLVLCVTALIGFAASLKAFGDSFRVGIDENKPDVLVTAGLFSISRNPLYVCFLLFFSGMFLIHRNALITVAMILFPIAIHRQIIREEAFLKNHYGDAYQEYCRKVRRYL